MAYSVPPRPKIYHIVHEDKLPAILATGGLLSDQIVNERGLAGTVIGMDHIKQRRKVSVLESHPGLRVGACVPFYFCPRSVMLFLIYKKNPELAYKGGQDPIIHLEADLSEVMDYADAENQRWAFTLSGAGSNYFEDRAQRDQLNEINWPAVAAQNWSSKQIQHGKQAEFLIENQFPWHLVRRIGVRSEHYWRAVATHLDAATHKPRIEILPNWYY